MRHVLILAAALVATPAMAQSMDSMTLASELGSVLAAEEFCGLTYNQDAVAAFISDKVKADDMSFPSLLNTMVQGNIFQQQSMTASAKTAHCTQVARVAKANGFVS